LKYVYIIKSESNPSKKYIGLTSNTERRLKEHNAGKSYHTAKSRPWSLVLSICFETIPRHLVSKNISRQAQGGLSLRDTFVD